MPNFVMISVDDMRTPSHWGRFTGLVETPNMDRLAAMGTSFERAVSQVPLCNPSRTSVLSGQQPTRTGVLDNQMPWFERVDPADTLPGVLKAAGAYVAMYGKNFHNEVAIDAAQQQLMFDDFLSGFPTSGSASQVISDEVRHDTPFASGRYRGSNLPDEATVDAAVDFLRNTAGDLSEPFFLGVGISKPHLNWWVPTRYFDLYDPAEIRAALRQSLQDGTIIPGNGEYFDVPPMSVPSPSHPQMAAEIDLWADYIHAYLAAVSYADAKVGQILDAVLADPAVAAETAILLWSDHGYHLGDKDRWGKFTHWRESTEVPFILVDPNEPGGQTANQTVSLVDIFPTVLDMMDVAVPSRLDLDGDSLLPIVRNPDAGWYNPATGRGIAMTTIDGSVSIRAQVPGAGDVRYTRYPDGTEELYNITRDPNEHVNRVNYDTGAGLTPADNALRATMSGLMDAELARNGFLVSTGRGQVVGTGADETLATTKGPGTNVLVGRGGDDTYILYETATVTEAAGGGSDMIVMRNEALESTFLLPAQVEKIQVQGDFSGNAGANRIIGSASANQLNGLGGNDTLLGLGGSDTLSGGAGNDTLRGAFAGDRLIGGAGRDTLDGGPAGDTFAFAATGDSAPGAPDTILAFNGPGGTAGDRIDLSAIDANLEIGGNQAFRFGGTATGRVWTVNAGGNTEVLANTDADPAAELRIVITDGTTAANAYSAADFTL